VTRFRYILGENWYYIIHAAFALQRGMLLRSIFFTGMIRDYAVEVAGLNNGLQSGTGTSLRDAHKLPSGLLDEIDVTLVKSLTCEAIAEALRRSTRLFLKEAHIFSETNGILAYMKYEEKMNAFLYAFRVYSL
ncbi:hypothetical protein IH574_04210, partial [Candidatus Bathyarchaeota archaeon]|nr:hypothetical protein [Candidatus Bathyarchaeota archaeon]